MGVRRACLRAPQHTTSIGHCPPGFFAAWLHVDVETVGRNQDLCSSPPRCWGHLGRQPARVAQPARYIQFVARWLQPARHAPSTRQRQPTRSNHSASQGLTGRVDGGRAANTDNIWCESLESLVHALSDDTGWASGLLACAFWNCTTSAGHCPPGCSASLLRVGVETTT